MKFALITGASRGIGRAIAEEFATRGKPVLLVSRNEQELRTVAAHIYTRYKVAAHILAADLSYENAPKIILEWCDQNKYEIDVLVNNAGYGLRGPFESRQLDDHLDMLQVNLLSVVRLTWLLLPRLKIQPRSYILNISSSSAYQALPFMAVYSASKIFVLAFSRALSVEMKGTPVSVTCISPGSTDTSFNDRAEMGIRAREMAKKVHMPASRVARLAVDAMYRGKTEVITGFINRLGAFLVWLLPKKFVEKTASRIYQ